MIKTILVTSLVIVLTYYTFIAFSEEGDVIDYYGECFVERADGSEIPIPCPEVIDQGLSKKDIDESVALLENFIGSDEDMRLKSVSSSLKQKGLSKEQRIEIARNLSIQEKRKSVKINDDGYVIRIIFFNDLDYPRKSRRHGIYFVDTEAMDLNFTQQWDHTILTEILGENYSIYQSKVMGVTKKNVIVDLSVADSEVLRRLLDGKKIQEIDHIGHPLAVYDEIRPVVIPTIDQ